MKVVDKNPHLGKVFDGRTWGLGQNRPVRDKIVPYLTVYLRITQEI